MHLARRERQSKELLTQVYCFPLKKKLLTVYGRELFMENVCGEEKEECFITDHFVSLNHLHLQT